MVYCTNNEYDLQAKTYPNRYTHHKLHNNNENKLPVFPCNLGVLLLFNYALTWSQPMLALEYLWIFKLDR